MSETPYEKVHNAHATRTASSLLLRAEKERLLASEKVKSVESSHNHGGVISQS